MLWNKYENQDLFAKLLGKNYDLISVGKKDLEVIWRPDLDDDYRPY